MDQVPQASGVFVVGIEVCVSCIRNEDCEVRSLALGSSKLSQVDDTRGHAVNGVFD